MRRRLEVEDGPEHDLAGAVVRGEAAAGGGGDEGWRWEGDAGGEGEGGEEAGDVYLCRGRGGLAAAEGVGWGGGEG